MQETARFLGLSRVAWIIIAGATIVTISMGVRNTFGIFLNPLSAEHGVSISMLSLAIALQNLVWGLAQPVAGAISDRHGAGRVIALGGVLYALGLVVAISFSDPLLIIFGGGILIGLAQSCTTFAVVLGVIGRNVEEKRRPMALGIASAGGSFGQMAIVPLAQGLISFDGLEFSILAMAALTFILVPLALPMAGKPSDAAAALAPGPVQALSDVLRAAAGHPGYILLTLGFFTCGFQVAFIGIHLPVYLLNCGLPTHVNPATLAATALATVGFFNKIGTYLQGLLGTRYQMKNLLALNYILRGVFILIFFYAPKSEFTVIAFAVGMGTLWLGTVPLTSGLVAKIFGPANLGLLFGVCFLSHQVGSFLGVWIGGYMFDLTGNYDLIWILTALAGFMAAAFNWPIKERALGQPA
ncbi:MAG: MFS transporter [Rickettsiales bacterium]